MQCPACNVTLMMTDRQGIEIDYCPQCRGVWLDRGELDKIIERSAVAPVAPVAPQPSSRPSPSGDFRRDSHYGHDHHHGKRHKKKSLLGEIFDF